MWKSFVHLIYFTIEQVKYVSKFKGEIKTSLKLSKNLSKIRNVTKFKIKLEERENCYIEMKPKSENFRYKVFQYKYNIKYNIRFHSFLKIKYNISFQPFLKIPNKACFKWKGIPRKIPLSKTSHLIHAQTKQKNSSKIK